MISVVERERCEKVNSIEKKWESVYLSNNVFFY